MLLLGTATLTGCGSSSDVEIGRSNGEETTAAPQTTDPETTAADTSAPETTDSETTDSETTDPDTSDQSESTTPLTTDTETTEPEPTDVETTVEATTDVTDPTIPFTTEIVSQVTCPSEDGSSSPVGQFPAPPPMCIDPARTYTATLTTNIGVMTLALDPAAAPLTVNSFVFLAGYHYFDGTTCHRIIPGFVMQCGDPTGTGTGGPGYEFPDELPQAGQYRIGSLAMANAGPNTNGSQFFIITGDDGASLSPDYSLFGEVTAGLDVLAAIDALGTDGAGVPTSPVDIESITIAVS